MNTKVIMDLIQLALNNKNISTENESKTLWLDSIWKYVILRWYNSWVHFGKLESVIDWVYKLSKTRRLWYWNNIKWIWLSSIAQYWVADDSKITCELPLIEITDNQISEVIPCSAESIKSIKEIQEYLP